MQIPKLVAIFNALLTGETERSLEGKISDLTTCHGKIKKIGKQSR